MKKLFILPFLTLLSFASEPDWTRTNYCPAGDLAEVEKILNSMTIEEKVGQVIMADLDFVKPSDLKKYPLGGILNGGNTSPRGKLKSTPAEWKSLAQEFHDESIGRGGAAIPVLWGTDAVHGHSNVYGATIFPHNIGLGATQNAELLESIGQAVAEEVLATGLFWTFAPTVTVPQDYRWGRTYEGYSESPELVARLGKAFVYGLQGSGDDFLNNNRIIGTAKHFLGDGGTFLGVDQGDTKTDEQSLRYIHGTSYFAALDACVQTVMASFNSWNGSKLHGNDYLLTEVLKNKMQFNGFVVGDWNGHGQVAGCSNANCAASFNAGVDMFMVPEDWKDLYRNTLRQAKKGEISKQRLDDAVRRILLVKERMGMFDGRQPKDSNFTEVGLQKNREIARQAVRESIVLLKNNNNVLPISRKARILVIGPDANSLRTQTGGWTLDWQGANNNNDDFPGSITFLEALNEVSQGSVDFVENIQARETDDYDIAIVAFGEQPYAEGVGDRKNLSFNRTAQIIALEKLKELNIPSVALFFSGRPLWVTREINLSDAFVAAWLPGTESRGMIDVLLKDEGDEINYDIKGRLPFSWPKTPFQANLNYFDPASDPLFAFGYGLDYSDKLTLEQYDENVDKEQLFGNEIDLLIGSVIDRFIGYIQENNLAQVQISGSTESQNSIVATDLIDTNKQDDTLRVTFQDSDNLNAFVIISKEIMNLNSFEDGYLQLTAKVANREKPLFISTGCGFGCLASIDVSNLFKESQSFTEYSIPFKCLVKEGLDLSKVNVPLVLFGEGPLSIDIQNIKITKEKAGKKLTCL